MLAVKGHLKITGCSRRRRYSGMTLIELLVAVGIGSVVFAVVASLTVFTARSFEQL
jgi:prepilin-type N-terminal cleavage/methylation domain-containing protein